MSWIKTTLVGMVTAGIAMTAPGPAMAANISTPIELPRKAELVAATPAEQRQANIDSTKALFPGATDAQAESYNQSYEALGRLAYEIDADPANNYARYVVDRTANFSATIYLKNAPASGLAKIKAAGIPGLTVVNDAKYTEEEASALAVKAFTPVAEAKLTVGLTAGYDWSKDRVVVRLAPAPGLTVSSISSRFPSTLTLPEITALGGLPASVPVDYVQSDKIVPTVMSGGTALSYGTSGGNTTAQCTAAFAVVGRYGNAANKRGLLTAEHCGTTLAYEATTQLTPVVIYDGSVKADTRMFYSPNRDVRRDFISQLSSSGALITKPALGKMKVGYQGKVCIFGTYSAQKYSRGQENCDYVESVGQPVNSCKTPTDCTMYYNQTITSSGKIEFGDSGGPWFIGNSAVGVQGSGYRNESTNTFTAATFQPIDDAERKTGSQVLTY